jgi:uncharacterized membrane protein
VATRDDQGAIKLSHLVHPSALNLGTGLTSGLLIGLIFLHSIFGVLVSAAAGAVVERLSECGVDDGFIKQIDDVFRPGRAALLLRRDISTERVVSDQIVARLASLGGRGVKTNLNASLEHRLQQAFDEARRSAYREAASSANSASTGLRPPFCVPISFATKLDILLFSAACDLIPHSPDDI